MDARFFLRRLRAVWLEARLRAKLSPAVKGWVAVVVSMLCALMLRFFVAAAGRQQGSAADALPRHVTEVISWLTRERGDMHECVGIKPCGSGGGRCVVSLCAVGAGELLLSVPPQLHLTSKGAGKGLTGPSQHVAWDSDSPPLCPQLSEWLAQPVAQGGAKGFNLEPGAMRLALRLLEERARGAASPWASYVATIPTSYPAILWDEAEQTRCLGGAVAKQRLLRRFERRAVEKALLRRCVAPVEIDELALDWAIHSVGSRSYENVGALRSGPHLAMVPIADMFNDGQAPNAQWTWEANAGSFQIRTIASVARGQEFLISYGSKNNEQLLAHYGFAHPLNKHDVLYVDLLPSPDLTKNSGTRIALSWGPTPSRSVVQRAFTAVRRHFSSRANQSARRSDVGDIDVDALASIRDACWRTVAESRVSPSTNTACAVFHENLLALADACRSFAQLAVGKEVLATSQVECDHRSAAVQLDAACAQNLSTELLYAWRRAAAEKVA